MSDLLCCLAYLTLFRALQVRIANVSVHQGGPFQHELGVIATLAPTEPIYFHSIACKDIVHIRSSESEGIPIDALANEGGDVVVSENLAHGSVIPDNGSKLHVACYFVAGGICVCSHNFPQLSSISQAHEANVRTFMTREGRQERWAMFIGRGPRIPSSLTVHCLPGLL